MGQRILHCECDHPGLLKNPQNWTPKLACTLAGMDGTGALTEQQRAFIQSLHSDYNEFHVPPPAVQACRRLNRERDCAHRLFDTRLQAWRIARQPDPGEKGRTKLFAE
jgi:sulfur relay (sulfurtransferase) DsrC/TusE family protein